MSVSADLVDLSDPALYEHGIPHELLTELRARAAVHEHVPIERPFTVPGSRSWIVLGHAEIERANRDWETYSAFDGVLMHPSIPDQRGMTLVSMDPPDHTRLRRLISAGFTPRMIERLDELIVTRTKRILDAAAERGEVDFVTDIAYQLPMHVIADIVGIPDADRPWVFERTELMLQSLDPSSPLPIEDGDAARAELFLYARDLGQAKRDDPQDDIWTILANASVVDDEGHETRLEGMELDMFFIILAIAGSETTRNAISQGLMALVDHPDQLAELRDDPGLLDTTANDEIIRWASPVLFFGRTATRDVELGGADVRAGDRVVLWYPSGNRDERAFDDPFRFDIHRTPNPHVSFGGGGPHYCLGASLAKKEVRTMTRALLERFDEIEVLEPPTWGGGGPVHNVGVSVQRLPVRLS